MFDSAKTQTWISGSIIWHVIRNTPGPLSSSKQNIRSQNLEQIKLILDFIGKVCIFIRVYNEEIHHKNTFTFS